MYRIQKRMEIAGAHMLALDYESKCTNIHGHNWIITVHCAVPDNELNDSGMVVDFTDIKRVIHDKLDHQFINEVVGKGINPTAENIAKWVCDRVEHCYMVEVQESEGNIAIYEKDN